jgi:alpha-galactosidase
MFILHVPVVAPKQNPTVRRGPGNVVVSDADVRLTLDLRSGRYGVSWKGATALHDLHGAVRLADDTYRITTQLPSHVIGKSDIRRLRDAFGTGVQITEHHRGPGMQELRNVFWVYKGRPEVFVRLDLVGGTTAASTRSLVPIETDSPIQIPQKGNLQCLFVPYDNDGYSRYRSDGWSPPVAAGSVRRSGVGSSSSTADSNGSYEVGAIYNSDTSGSIVVGSIDHDTWKSAVRFVRDVSGGPVSLRTLAGIADKQTRDHCPPGLVSGTVVRSPRFVIGSYASWQKGLERFGDLNAIVKKPLPWRGAVPFGWSSWSGHKDHVNAADARAATDFIATKLPWFRSGGTAFINLDSFWDNLKPAEIEEFVKHAHALGLKAGIYYTPFTGWGRLTDRVRGTPFTYQDIVLKDETGAPMPKLDGGYPLDPTHPGSLIRIDRQLDQFVTWGFDYVKLDFMTHAALEGKHYNPRIATGTQAYNFGLQNIDDRLSAKRVGRPIFIDLSIAPLFPSGYAHARRVSCDVFANIGATEYLLNATTYGFWTNHRLYRFNDPDSSCVYQPLGESPVTEAEARSRFTASVITGGMMIAGDDFTKPEACRRVLSIFSNRELLALARKAPAFHTMDGATGSKASDGFERSDGKSAYIVLFNFTKTAVVRQVSGSEIPGKMSSFRELWSGKEYAVVPHGAFIVPLGPYDCAVLKAEK